MLVPRYLLLLVFPILSAPTPTPLGPQKTPTTVHQPSVVNSTLSTTSAHVTTSTNLAPTPPEWSEFGAEEPVENDEVAGCRWPTDYLQRLDFCQEKAKINYNGSRHGSFAAFDSTILAKLLETCRLQPANCGRINASAYDYELFVHFWLNNTSELVSLAACLQLNAKGMAELCGGQESNIGKVISGAGGLHLNLLQILISVASDLQQLGNTTDDCLISTAVSVHLTAALHVQSKIYRNNSVMCWDLSHKCSQQCAQLASSLNCLHHSCPSFTPAFLQQFPIWQWYFNSPQKAAEMCPMDSSDTCQGVPRLNLAGNDDSLRAKAARKLREFRGALETYFHQPISLIAGVFAAALLLLIGISVVCCLWYQGGMPRRSRVVRYRILGEKGEESRSLAVDNEFDNEAD